MKASGKNNFLIDGFPRNKDNVDGWNQAMEGKVNVQCILFFDCSEEVRCCCCYLKMLRIRSSSFV